MRGIEILTIAGGPDYFPLSVHYHNLGWLYLEIGRNEEAEQALRKALGIAERSFGAKHLRTAEIRVELALALIKLDRDAEAAAQLERGVADLEAEGMAETKRQEALTNQARLAWKKGDQDKAITLLSHALDLADEARASRRR